MVAFAGGLGIVVRKFSTARFAGMRAVRRSESPGWLFERAMMPKPSGSHVLLDRNPLSFKVLAPAAHGVLGEVVLHEAGFFVGNLGIDP